jgi:hypothetical protein
MFEVAVKVERLSLGESTENVEQVMRQGAEDDALYEAVQKDPDLLDALEKLLDATEPE